MLRFAFLAGMLFAVPAYADIAWVTNQSSDDVSVVDLAHGTVVATIPVGGQPAGVAAAPNGSDTIFVLDAKVLAVVAEIEVGDGPRAFGHFPTRD